jgi:predicted permease
MMNILLTILPIFVVIAVGWFAHAKAFMPATFTEPANRLVYYLAIPAMIFSAIAKAPFDRAFNPVVLGICLAVMVAVAALAFVSAAWLKIRPGQAGTYIQSTFHGNLGYIGLAVVFYHLGSSGLGQAGVIAGFMMILQNLLAVVTLQFNASGSARGRHNLAATARRIMLNPIILSALAGLLYSISGAGLPAVFDRSLSILSAMALPLALLLIGASLSLELLRHHWRLVCLASLFKLVLLPAGGLGLFLMAGLNTATFQAALILLAAPSATLTYVMAKEMEGSPELAVTAISTSTLLSALSLSVWLFLTG